MTSLRRARRDGGTPVPLPLLSPCPVRDIANRTNTPSDNDRISFVRAVTPAADCDPLPCASLIGRGTLPGLPFQHAHLHLGRSRAVTRHAWRLYSLNNLPVFAHKD